MTYRAITAFADLQDGKRRYEAGEIYPRPGLIVSNERLRALAGSDNAAHRPLIEAIQGGSEGLEGADDEIPVQPAKTRQSRRKRQVNTDA